MNSICCMCALGKWYTNQRPRHVQCGEGDQRAHTKVITGIPSAPVTVRNDFLR